MIFSNFKGKADNKPREDSLSWPDFCARVSAPVVRADKDGPLFSPAQFDPARRAKANVTELSALALDLDHGATLADDLPRWRRLGYTFGAYTTHSHRRVTESNQNAEERFRVVLPLATPIPALYWPALWQWADKMSGGKLDAATKDQSRIFYWPAKADAGAEYYHEIHDGRLLDWRDLLPLKYAAAAVEGEMAALSSAQDGDRNNQLFKSAAALGELIAGGVLEEDRITKALEEAAAKIGLDAGEIGPTIKSGLRTGRSKPRTPDSFTAEGDGEKRQAQRETADDKAPAESGAAAKLAVSWADFDAEQFVQGERIAFAVERGELALLNALPNAGKTTLALNVALALAAGRNFPPIVMERKPRRVLYVDGETRRARLQRDLRTMTKGFSRGEAMTAGQNLQLICEGEIKGEALALTRTDHLLAVLAEALSLKPDFIVIDTLASLCPVFNENDNAEQTRKIWRPLQKIARDCDAAVLVNHHVGKRSEDGQSPERVYRGRGASASGGAARAVWLLIPDPVTPGLSTLSCVKAKGEAPADVRLQLDQATRWLRTLEAAPPPPTPLELIVSTITRAMTTAEIVAALKDKLKGRAVKDYLAEAVEQSLIRKLKHGLYGPESAESAEDENAQPALSAQSPEIESAESARAIGSALSALSDKANKTDGLEQSADCADTIGEHTLCTFAGAPASGQAQPRRKRVSL